MAKLPIDLSHFHKVHQDENTTTLEHKKGHQIKLAHKSLDPKMRGQLAGLPMKDKEERKQTEAKHEIQHLAKGGKVMNNYSSSDSKKKEEDPDSRPAHNGIGGTVRDQKSVEKGFTESGAPPVSEWAHNIKTGLGFAEGGKVCEYCGRGEIYSDANNPKLEESKKHLHSGGMYAEGGVAEKQDDQSQKPITINVGQPPQTPSPQAQEAIGNFGKPEGQIPTNAPGQPNNDPLNLGIPNAPQELRGQPPGNQPEQQSIAPQPEQQDQQVAGSEAPTPDAVQAPQNPLLQANMNEAQQQAQAAQQQVAGIQNEAAAKGHLGEQEAKMEEQHLQNVAQQQKDYTTHLSDLEAERSNFVDDLNNGHIDPNHYMNSMGTGKRVATAIGLILGGMGSGITGGENPVLKFLNNQIDRDIDSQKQELGKKQSLLQANLRQFGNLNDATNMTKVMSADIIAHQLAQAAAKAQSPIEKARAQQAIASIQAQLAPMVKQLAFSRTLLSQNGGNSRNMDPAMLINSIVPKEQRPKAFEQLKEAEGMAKAKTNLLSGYDKVAKLQTLSNRIGSPLQSKRQIDAIIKPLTAQLSKDTAGRFTEQDAGMLETLWPKVQDNQETIDENRKKLQNLIEQKMNFPQLTGLGIDPSKFNSTSGEQQIKPEHQKFADFAKKNPNHPASQAIKKKLGL